MPIYEYECRQCGHRFEYLVLTTSPAAECPVCQKKDLEQLISLAAVSSDATKQASLNRAHKIAAAQREGKRQDEHKELHEHFEDKRSIAG
jgi:putative FmdB family regulatory protein